MMKACRMAFTAGFEKSKSMVQAYHPNMSVKSLYINLLDRSLGTIVSEGIETIVKIT